MSRLCVPSLAALLTVLATLALSSQERLSSQENTQDWPNWRGPNWTGSSQPDAKLVVDFDREKNVRWRTAMPGPGASTPIVLGDRIFLTSTDTQRDRLVAMCLDRKTGKAVWTKDAGSGYQPRGGAGDEIPRVKRAFSRSNYASPSPSTDGERVVFFFGNGDLVVYDLAGEEAWRTNIQQEHGDFEFQWTFSASPTLWDTKVFVPVLQRDTPVNLGGRGGNRGPRNRGDRNGGGGGAPGGGGQEPVADPIASFLLCYDATNGKLLWKKERPSPARVESLESYTTLVPHTRADGSHELVLAGGDVLTGHDPATGNELWRWGTWNEGHRQRAWRLVPSVVIAPDLGLEDCDGIALVCAPKRAPAFAIRLGGKGDLGDDALIWQSEGRGNPVSTDVPTPAYHDGHFYVLSDVRQALSKVDAKTGKTAWATEIPVEGRDLLRASPTVAGGHVWFQSHSGTVFVVETEKGGLVHSVRMTDEDAEQHARSGIVAAHGDVFVRTDDSLYCIGKD